MGLLVASSLLNVLLFEIFRVLLEARDLALKVLACLPQLIYVRRHLIFLLLGHESLSHTVRYGRLVKALVCGNGLPNLIAHPHEKESALGAVHGDLTDELIKALRIELLADCACTSFTGLPPLKRLIKSILQLDNIDAIRRSGRHVTYPESSIFSVLARR